MPDIVMFHLPEAKIKVKQIYDNISLPPHHSLPDYSMWKIGVYGHNIYLLSLMREVKGGNFF